MMKLSDVEINVKSRSNRPDLLKNDVKIYLRNFHHGQADPWKPDFLTL